MTIRIFGAILVVAACGGFGFLIAAAHRREVRTLQHFLNVLDHMECELQYRLTPLPELCRQAANISKGCLQTFFLSLSKELDNQIKPNVDSCVKAAIAKTKDLPVHTCNAIRLLGQSLGCFDINGQLSGLNAVRHACQQKLEALSRNQDVRIRSYQTLGVCAGAAMAILFI